MSELSRLCWFFERLIILIALDDESGDVRKHFVVYLHAVLLRYCAEVGFILSHIKEVAEVFGAQFHFVDTVACFLLHRGAPGLVQVEQFLGQKDG